MAKAVDRSEPKISCVYDFYYIMVLLIYVYYS